MKAITYGAFGDIDVLELSSIELPSPSHDAVQVRVVAASLNPIDGKIRRGELKLMSGSHFPKIAGQDFSGVVVAVGREVTTFAVGDEVYGCCRGMKDGALAELVNAPAAFVAKKPPTLDHLTAASVPIVAQAAMQSLAGVAHVRAGTRVLVNGCTGGVGLYALQLAKRMGAEVTGVCGTSGVELAREYGASTVIDYTKEDVLASGREFDALLELSGRLPFDRAHAVLAHHATYVDFSPSPAGIVGNTLANPFRDQKHKFVMTESRTADLDSLRAAFESGELRPAPVRVFAFEDFREAYRLVEKGSVLGKVVLKVGGAS